MSDPIVGKNGNIKFVSEPRMDSYYRVVQGSPTEEALRQKVLEALTSIG